ncbi:hypothetical protein [uncultured Thiodictyon sp.]|nr:hypothetical protein [uncultured Thiodictyon sp.]
MLTVLDLAFTDLVNQSRWLSVGHVADHGSGLEPLAGVIAGAPGGAASA